MNSVKKTILDILFPIRCIFCRKEYFWVCPTCRPEILLNSFQFCPYCEKIVTLNGSACENCQKNKDDSLDSLIVAGQYTQKELTKLIHLFKYNFISELHIPLGDLLLRAYLKNTLPLPSFIIPVPLHPKRLRWRGFNQSELLGRYLSQNLAPGMEIPLSQDGLFRKRYTSPQMKIKNYHQRKANLKDAFRIKNKQVAQNKIILLVDDVATTGSTLFECARILKNNGAKKVFGIVLGRQVYSRKI
jgi:ComF family protein